MKTVWNRARLPLLGLAPFLGLALILTAVRAICAEIPSLPSLPEVLASKVDLWGEAALHQTNGPSYEFFAPLLPPVRYVNADFRDYPIVLSAPRGLVKARLVSNGSSINGRAGTRTWTDPEVPITFRVGSDEFRFGEYPDRLSEPNFLKGHLPIVQIHYAHGEAIYEEECFAAVEPELSARGVVFVRFTLASGGTGTVAAQVDARNDVKPLKGCLLDENGEAIVWYDNNWRWARQRLVANLNSNSPAVFAIATRPIARRNAPLTAAQYDESRRLAIAAWESVLQTGMQLELPDGTVSNAWRATLIASVALTQTNRLNSSAGNQSEKINPIEAPDAAEALLLWGQNTRDLLPQILSLTRKGFEFTQAAERLQLLTRWFWLTRDTDLLNSQAAKWTNDLQLILGSRTNSAGLLPPEPYGGDMTNLVLSLNENARCWRALRDFAPVLVALGRKSQSDACLSNVAVFRDKIFAAVEKSELKTSEPPFIPMALLGDEEPYETLTETRNGTSWNLMANSVLGSRVFGPGTQRETSLLDYIDHHGGICLGMVRSRPGPGFWSSQPSLVPLQGLGRFSILLERDEPEKALVAFYGLLAQALTRNTFVGGEACSIAPLDARGRQFAFPPNTGVNACFLTMLRDLVVQDLDLDDDGEPETLRLLFATPRRWLDDQKVIRVERAPTAFGPVSVSAQSHLEEGFVNAAVEIPRRLPRHTLLRLRLPEGWRVLSAQTGDRKLRVDDQGTTELVGMLGKVQIRFAVEPVP